MIQVEFTPHEKHYRARCKCGCVFTFDQTDQKLVCFGHGEFWDVVMCPHCLNYIGRPGDQSTVEEI